MNCIGTVDQCHCSHNKHSLLFIVKDADSGKTYDDPPPPGNEIWDSPLIFAGVMLFAIEVLKFLTVALSWAVMCSAISIFKKAVCKQG